ncbi:MAG TPA: Xaa-Pro peptidase family protein [Gemmatimonadaceae bacterium]|nr:Xaa-Pro peptidase family protein [Gemmatimonadaceae bacterium]
MLSPRSLPAVQEALAEAGVDGWLLYDFRGLNPIAHAMLRLEGMVSRRVLAWVPSHGTPVALTHAIEEGPWARWPREWERRVYLSWRSLEEEVARLVRGKRVMMEYSPGDAVPVVDRVPAGVLELVRASGATVVTSGDLVSRFFAVWDDAQLASHRRVAEQLARVAKEAIARAGALVRRGTAIAEHELMAWIRGRFDAMRLTTDHGPNVSAGENAANPHYEPSPGAPRLLRDGDVVLVDLWATEPGGMWADQTWMGSIGAPSPKLAAVWTVVRGARDAAIALLRERAAVGTAVRGAEVDRAARRVIEAAGYGAHFTHRTGHSMDARALHGSGPNLDDLETREERVLVPGVGFSIEPGVYLPGEFGVRSEVNAYLGVRELVVTPAEIQQDLMVV